MNKFKDSIHDIILGEKISDNIYLDNNGQLICENVVLARTGNYDYREDELLENGSPEKIVQVYRSPEEVFDETSIKSMNYKPLVDEHPEDNVTPETVGELQKGFMTNVRRGVGESSNCLMADLVITDPYVIELVRSGRKRELSVGYTADILEENGQYVMKNIRGNHIALCEAGRAGNARIRDSRAKLDDATVEAKGSFNSLEELKKHYAGATVNKAGSKCEVTLRNGTKLLYSCLDGDKDGKLLFIRKVSDTNTKVDEVKENELKDSGDIYEVIVVKKDKDGDLESDSIFVEASSASNARKKVGKKYGDVVEVNLATWREKGSADLVADAELPDPADEKELDRTHFIPDAKYKSGTVLKHVDGGKSEVISKVITESGVNGANTEKYLMKSGKKFVTEDIDTSKNWSEVMDSANGEDFDSMKFGDMADMAYVTPGRRVPAHNEYHNRISFDDLRRTVNKVMEDGTNPYVVNILIGQLSELMEDYKADIKNPKLDKSETKEHYKKYKKLVEAHKNSKISPAYTKAVNNFISTIKDSLRPFRVSVGGRKFDTMATSFADAVQKVRSRLKEADAELIVKNKELTGSINDVYPNKGESKEDFISRFMSETKAEYPDQDQRLAVAHAYWKKGVKDSKTVTYKGYAIEFDFYGQKEYTVQYQGDDVWFKSESEAKKFIDGIVSGKITDSKEGSFAILHPTRNEFLSVGGRSWVKEDSTNIQKFSSYDEAMEFGRKYVTHQFRIFKFFDSKLKDSKVSIPRSVALRLDDIEIDPHWYESRYNLNFDLNDHYLIVSGSRNNIKKFLEDFDMREYEIKDSKFSDAKVYYEDLRKFCIENNYYTRGTIKDYDNLLMNCDKWSLYEIASDIAQHSNGVWSTEVLAKLRKKFKDSLHVTDHDVEETTEDVANAPKSFQLREYVGNLIDDEVEAIQGYDETLLRMDLDEETRKTLEEIRNEELDHTDKLNSIYKSLTKDPKPVEDDMYGLVKEPEFRYFMVTVLEKSAKWGDEEFNYFVRAKDESEARKKVTGKIVRIVESNHSEYLKAKHHGMVVDAGMVGYLFPKLNRNDLLNAYKYGLGLGAVNPFKGEEGTFLLGSLENIKKYAEDYLDYELVKGYLVKGKSLTHDSVSKFDLAKFTSDPETSYTLIGNSEERIELSEKDEKNSKLINALKSAGFKQKNSWLFVRG